MFNDFWVIDKMQLRDIYLKYKTPKKPHQNEPSAVKYIPLLKLLFIEIKIYYYIIS